MKQSLQLRVSQQLTMTPQLQQAIRMLQLSTLELQTEIQQALDSNLMLEEEGELHEEAVTPTDQSSQSESQLETQLNREEHTPPSNSPEEGGTLDENTAMPDELPVDSNWDDLYDMAPVSNSSNSGDDGEERDFDYGRTHAETLQDHLIWQMQMGNLSATDTLIAEAIIDSIDADGFLHTPLQEILDGLIAQQVDVEMDEMVAVLHCIQQYDPPGVGACNLKESLILQLKALPLPDEQSKLALLLISRHFDLLANREYNQIMRRMHISESQLNQLTQLIQGLNPRPGSHFSTEPAEYVIPDVFVRKQKGRWLVELNADAAPRIRINSQYAGMIQQLSASDSTTMKNHLQEARWFIKSLISRNETLLKVATSIVEHQRDFLEQGAVAMKAMILADIASELGMHESTISRTTTRKYMHTPRGIFELKYFFSSHVATDGGGECSSTAIRAMIKQLVADEPPKKPLSDNKITNMLAEKGIKVARRTIAKYREAMMIPPSNERKRLS